MFEARHRFETRHGLRRSLAALALTLCAALASAPAGAETGKDKLADAQRALAQHRSASTLLAVADAHRELFQLDEALESYAAATAADHTPKAAIAEIDYLLALAYFDRAAVALDAALLVDPNDGTLLEQRAVLAASRGDHAAAVRDLESAWAAGRDPLAWLERGRLQEHLYAEPYRSLLDAGILMSDLDKLEEAAQETRLRLLAEALDEDHAAALTTFVAKQQDAELIRLGLRALRRLPNPSTYLLQLLDAQAAAVRRAALLEVWRSDEPARYRTAIAARLQDADPGTADLAEAFAAILDSRQLDPAAAERVLRAVPARNSYRHLALAALSERLQRDGQSERAAQVDAERAALEPSLAAARGGAASLAGYWECMERRDLKAMRELLHHHQFVERIDASVYGLPRNDFDDQKLLTIPERLFLRSYHHKLGQPLGTEGPMQYPREISHLLRRIEKEQGRAVDCSGLLADLPPATRLLQDDGETKVEEDGNVDNEVNISVNPYDPRYVIVTSNDYDGATGNDLNRSSNWGNSWTGGDVAISGNCCDPVTQYTRTNVSGTMTDVAYHSTLVSSSGGGYGSRLLYSTNNGANWTDCGYTIGSNRDRQDHAIDSNPSSACYNKIYLAHHSGTQYVATSTGATFPYCQSFSEVSTGVGSTIGSAIVVSTNGVAHNFFTQYGSPGGVYHTKTSNCGSTWGSSVKLVNVMNAGTFEWPIPSTCNRQIYRYPQAGTDSQASSAYRNNIYVVWNDLSGNCTAPGCNGNTTCNNDIYLLTGTPNDRTNPSTWTWTSRNLTDALSDDFTDEFYPSISVDTADGAIYVSYYRTNSGASSITPRKTQVHYVMTKSIDGGVTFAAPVQITDLPTDESGSGANASMQWGDYTWNDVINGTAYAAWTDRREGADEDVWAAKICSEPTHWSERAPTFAAPATTATNTSGLNYTISWALPNVYWGDADENNAARKFQLWVDGALAQDNISATATSVAWTAPNTASHSVYVRAVNQCGVGKNYAAATVGSGGGNTAPAVTITAPANGSSHTQGTSVTFTGTATDTQDGTISANLAWSSSINGSLGTGASIATSALSLGTHTITASVTDSGGLPGSANISINVTAPPSNVLSNGVPVTGMAAATGNNRFFTMAVPAGATNLSFVTSGGTGDLDLYVRFNTAPTTTTADCSSTSGTNAETCSFATPSTGTYHVLVYAYATYSGAQIVGSYTAPGGPVTVTFYSVGGEDGRIYESTETSGVGGGNTSADTSTTAARIGDWSDDTQYRSIFSFDTSSIPDTATITAATLRIKRGALTGGNPFSTMGSCTVDMSSAFGGAVALANGDFSAAASASGVATMSNPASNGTFSTGTLSAAGRSAVNKTGKTQFRVYMTTDDNDNATSDYMGFYGGEAASGNRPELVITYQP